MVLDGSPDGSGKFVGNVTGLVLVLGYAETPTQLSRRPNGDAGKSISQKIKAMSGMKISLFFMPKMKK